MSTQPILTKGSLSRLIRIISILLFIGGIALFPFVFSGFTLYYNAICLAPVEERIAALQAQPDYTPLEEIAPTFTQAIVAIEDHRFYTHFGIDPLAILRATKDNIQAGGFKYGGSTITQQLAKNLFFSFDKTLERKIAEALMAIHLEWVYDKETLLECYVNAIYYGDGYTGIAEAAQGYFQKKPSDLNDVEAMLLAGMPQAPSIYSQDRHFEKTQRRTLQVVEAMRSNGKITGSKAREIQKVVHSMRRIACVQF